MLRLKNYKIIRTSVEIDFSKHDNYNFRRRRTKHCRNHNDVLYKDFLKFHKFTPKVIKGRGNI